MIRRTSKAEVQSRLRELYKMLHEPCSVDDLAARTGRSKKMVYKDLAKLAFQGCVLCSDRGMYWIEG